MNCKNYEKLHARNMEYTKKTAGPVALWPNKPNFWVRPTATPSGFVGEKAIRSVSAAYFALPRRMQVERSIVPVKYTVNRSSAAARRCAFSQRSVVTSVHPRHSLTTTTADTLAVAAVTTAVDYCN